MIIKEFNQINCCMDRLEETRHGEQCKKACFVGYILQGCISNDLTNKLNSPHNKDLLIAFFSELILIFSPDQLFLFNSPFMTENLSSSGIH